MVAPQPIVGPAWRLANRPRRDRRRGSLGDRLEREIEEHVDVGREIERAEAEPERAGPSLRRTAIWLAITGVSLYLVAPSLLDVLGSWRDLDRIDWIWFPAMLVLQVGGLACLWAVQRMALHRARWPDVIESQLAGNAVSKIAPAGGAIGAALQYKMLVASGLERGRTVAGITAVNLLTFAVVLALPVLALPAFLRGSVDRNLVEATVVGVVVFALLLGGGDRRARLRPPARARRPRGAVGAKPPPAALARRCAPCPRG